MTSNYEHWTIVISVADMPKANDVVKNLLNPEGGDNFVSRLSVDGKGLGTSSWAGLLLTATEKSALVAALAAAGVATTWYSQTSKPKREDVLQAVNLIVIEPKQV